MMISIVVPIFNEAQTVHDTLAPLQHYRHSGHEIIVVDGGSCDDSPDIAEPLADQVLRASEPAERGRSIQMNRGAAVAKGQLLLFLHCDTQLPSDAMALLAEKAMGVEGAWGRFDVALSGQRRIFRVVEYLINIRSRITGIATGDQAIFVSRELFDLVGGYGNLPLMEDIDLSRRLKRYRRPICFKQRVITSSRRWETYGVARTILLMWFLRFGYWIGVRPNVFARFYS